MPKMQKVDNMHLAVWKQTILVHTGSFVYIVLYVGVASNDALTHVRPKHI